MAHKTSVVLLCNFLKVILAIFLKNWISFLWSIKELGGEEVVMVADNIW